MNKEQKINYIRYFLQKFGERKSFGFVISLYKGDSIWQLGLEFNYDNNGNFRKEPYCWCVFDDKHLPNSDVKNRNDSELDEIISLLRFMIENKAQDYMILKGK